MIRNASTRGGSRPRRCMDYMEWLGWIGFLLIVYYLYERIQEFDDIMPSNSMRHMTRDATLSRIDNATSTYKHVMRHTKHEDTSSKGIYKWLLGKFKIQTTTHIDDSQYMDSLRAITTGKDYGNHGSFALPGSNIQYTDRIEEHSTYDELVRKSKVEGGDVALVNADVEVKGDKRPGKETTLLDQFSVSTLHSVEKFHSDAEALKPHIEKPEEDEVNRMNVTIIDNRKNDINSTQTRRGLLRGGI